MPADVLSITGTGAAPTMPRIDGGEKSSRRGVEPAIGFTDPDGRGDSRGSAIGWCPRRHRRAVRRTHSYVDDGPQRYASALDALAQDTQID
jgi:hypothetical protein